MVYTLLMAQINIYEAKTQLSRLVTRAEAGEEIVIARNGHPVARLLPARSVDGLAAVRGAWSGRVRIADDFDELPDDIAEALGAH